MLEMNHVTSSSKKEYSLQPNNSSDSGFAGSFLRIQAYVCWFVGVLGAVVFGEQMAIGYDGFNWGIFVAIVIGAIIGGGFFFSMGEVADNISSIANSLRGMKITEINESTNTEQESSKEDLKKRFDTLVVQDFSD